MHYFQTSLSPLFLVLSIPFIQSVIHAQDSPKELGGKVYSSDFSTGHKDWKFTDKSAWKIVKHNSKSALSLHQKKSSYSPKFRSPLHIALLKDVKVSDFQLDVKILSTHKDYGHRDVCLFFGYQSPSKFYYVHLGKKTDNHANQIFIVNEAARTKISSQTTEGTDWDDDWHHVRIRRNTKSGQIEVFFDDMKKPVMLATDKNFTWGQIGLGSFDDTADFMDLVILGDKHEK